METIFLIGRIILGGYFLYNAYNHFTELDALTGYAQSKKVPHAKVGVIVTGLMLLFGGAAVLTGIFMVTGAWALIIFLVATSIMMHAYWKIADPMNKMNERINFQKNMALVGALLVIIALRM